MSDLKTVVGAPGFRPSLRQGLSFYRDPTSPGVVVIHDLQHDSRLQLYEVECLIAKHMDGTRDLEAIARAAKSHVPWATREQVEKLTIQIAGMGLLANVSPPIRSSGTIRAQGTPQLIQAQNDDSEQLDAEALFEDRTTLEPASANMSDDPAPEPAPAAPATPAWSPDFAARVDAAMSTAGPVSAPQPAQVGADEPLLLEPEPEPEPEPEFPPPQQAREQPVAEEPWVVEKTPWYKRTWFRRLRYIAVPVLVIVVLRLIPYPLYVTEPCLVVPSQKAYVRTPMDGLIAEIYVGEGDFVEAGAPLARLDDRNISFELQKAEAELQRLRSALAKQTTGSRPEEVKRAEARVRTAASDVHFAKKKLRRTSDLLKAGVGSVQERDEAQRDLALKKSLLSEAYAELKLVKAGFRSEEVAIAQAEVRRAQAEVQHYKEYMDNLVIKAPIAGRVLTPRFRQRLNEKLKEGDLVAEIGDVSTMRVEIQVPERETDVVQVGQPVTLKVHSLPLQAFEGRVTFIAPAVEETKEGQRILRVDAEIVNAQGLLQAGMTGYAEIDAGERTVLGRITRRAVRWIRVRFLL